MTPQEKTVRAFRQRWAFEALYTAAAPETVADRNELHARASRQLSTCDAINYLEFGVYAGETLGKWAANLTSASARLFGFDSFLGLPEVWDVGFREFEKGTFSTKGALPPLRDPRIEFVKGWFQNTLPAFLEAHAPDMKRVIMVHFDADLYSSTLFVLTTLWHHIPEYFFIMDDFSQDDAIALHDFSKAYPVQIEWLVDVAGSNQLPRQVFGKMRRTALMLDKDQSEEIIPTRRFNDIAISSPYPVLTPEHCESAQGLMLNLESLGSDCEFGLVQRHFQAEPLGLLRWANMQPQTLVSLLQTRFSGFAEPSTLTLQRSPWREYFIHDLRHGINFHTWQKDIQTDEKTFFEKHCVRLRWLRDKLVETLTTADKTFVYKLPNNGASLEELSKIAVELRRFGHNHVLCVAEAGATGKPKYIEHHDNGLTIGYLSRFGFNTISQKWEILFEEWEAICWGAVDARVCKLQ